MKQIFIALLKWSVLLVSVDLTSSLIHEDLIQIAALGFVLFMFIKLLPQYADKPFSGLVFSILVVFLSGVSATSLMRYAICEWYPGIKVCLPNFLSALSFGFFVFPALIIVPWGAMAIRKFTRIWIR